MFFAGLEQTAVPCRSQAGSEQHKTSTAQHDCLLQDVTVNVKAAMQILTGRLSHDQTDEAPVYDGAHTAMT